MLAYAEETNISIIMIFMFLAWVDWTMYCPCYPSISAHICTCFATYTVPVAYCKEDAAPHWTLVSFFFDAPPKTNMAGWKLHHLKMYFRLKHGDFPTSHGFNSPGPSIDTCEICHWGSHLGLIKVDLGIDLRCVRSPCSDLVLDFWKRFVCFMGQLVTAWVWI